MSPVSLFGNESLRQLDISGHNTFEWEVDCKSAQTRAAKREIVDARPLEHRASRTKQVIVKSLEWILRRCEHGALIRRTADAVAASEPRSRVTVTVTPQYPNMRRFVDAFPQVVDVAERAIRAEGIEVVREPIRGGTDGSVLSQKGLPTPNLFTGGHEYHSVREWASVKEMAAAAAVVVRLAGVWAERWDGAAPRPS